MTSTMHLLIHSIQVGHTFLDPSTPHRKVPATHISFVISSSFQRASKESSSCSSGIISRETAVSLLGIQSMVGLKGSILAVNFLHAVQSRKMDVAFLNSSGIVPRLP